jgi:hypothetical protein
VARVSQRLYRQVAARARDRCEYCGLPQEAEVMDLTVDHVVRRHSREISLDFHMPTRISSATSDLRRLDVCCWSSMSQA